MLRFILRRSAYSLLIMLGVLLLVFAMFNLSSGDPAATVLGKNPTASELENMRLRLGSGKPLVAGNWRTTELYSSADFSGKRSELPGVSAVGVSPLDSGVKMDEKSKLVFRRNFTIPENRVLLEFRTTAPIRVNGIRLVPKKGVGSLELRNPPAELTVTAENGAVISAAVFFRPTAGFFDSQLFDTFGEIVSFRKTFPFLTFFNFGETLLTRESIRGVLWRGTGASLLLMIPIFLGELILGIVLAMLSAIWRGSWPDRIIMIFSVAGMSISYLAMIIFAQWIFGYYFNWFPVWGWGDVRYILLPVAVGIFSGTGSGVRFYRTVFLNEMNREYLRTARAKGCSPSTVYFKHLLKNAAVPILTRASTVLPFLFTGSLLLESFFGIPGLGFKGVDALNSSDLQTLKALVLLGAFLFILINLITDLLYAWADPRIRPEK